MILKELHEHDSLRLQRLGDLVGQYPGSISFEGEPIYADQDWGPFHEFSYGILIPALARPLRDRAMMLDVLYDDLTPEQPELPAEHFLDLIHRAIPDLAEDGSCLTLCRENESDMLDQARAWVSDLDGRGFTTTTRGAVELNMPGERGVSLTTRSGRPSCSVLDAVYQTAKAEAQVDTSVLVHNTVFRGQQLDMQAVLRAVHGEIPFSSFINVFMRERKGRMRLAGITALSQSGISQEVN